MASKRDQLQSHQFLVQRMISALVTRESDPEQPPFRRPTVTAFWSIGLAVLAVVCVGVYGLIRPGGNKAWQGGELVIVEKETGTRYVYADGRLHPVTNYASALLALGKDASTKNVSRRSLADVPRGPLIGIRDAPDALPDRKLLLTGGWTLCSQPVSDPSGAPTSESVLMVGTGPAGGQPLDGQALLVQVIDSQERYLIMNGYRHRLQDPRTVVAGLALSSEPWARVGSAFVDALPAGQPIGPLGVSGIGKASSAMPNRRALVGQLFVSKNSAGGVQHYLVERNGLRPISRLQFDIQRAYRPLTAAFGGKPPYGIGLDLVSAGSARVTVPAEPENGRPPRERPRFAAPHDGAATVCAAFAPGMAPPAVTVDPAMPPRDATTVTPRRTVAGTVLADRVVVPPGHAAVVEVMPTRQAPAGTISVITDQGRCYPLADPKVLEILGYAGVHPVLVPAGLVARIPQGPGLDPAAATHPAAP